MGMSFEGLGTPGCETDAKMESRRAMPRDDVAGFMAANEGEIEMLALTLAFAPSFGKAP